MSSSNKGAAQPAPQTTATSKTEKEKGKQEKKKAPTKTQGEKWTSSINSLLNDPEGVAAFRTFLVELEQENDEEGEHTKYIDFYLECQAYKAEFERLEDKAKQISKDYLEVGAEKEVGTGGKSVEIGDKLEKDGLEGVKIFDEPLKKVIEKLADGVYVNYCLDIKKKLKL